jgi:hypothetical protein
VPLSSSSSLQLLPVLLLLAPPTVSSPSTKHSRSVVVASVSLVSVSSLGDCKARRTRSTTSASGCGGIKKTYGGSFNPTTTTTTTTTTSSPTRTATTTDDCDRIPHSFRATKMSFYEIRIGSWLADTYSACPTSHHRNALYP